MKNHFLCKIVMSFMLLVSGTSAATAVGAHGALHVTGNQILDQNNQVTALHGMSFYWSHWMGDFYNASTVGWLASDWHANVLRAAVAVGASDQWSKDYIDDPTGNWNRLAAVVDAAIANGIYVLIDWHSGNAEAYQSQAIAFFTKAAQTYGSKPNVIFEIYNEPSNTDTWANVKNYANAVIPVIRQYSNNLILVGSPHWDQDLDIATSSPITGVSNLAYTFHFYAGTHTVATEGAKAQTALNRGYAVFISEWGTSNADGNGGPFTDKAGTWLTWAAARNLSWCNWSVSDAPETSAALASGSSTTGNWNGGNLTTSGAWVRSQIIGANPAQNGYSASTGSSSSSIVVSSSSSVVISSSSGTNVVQAIPGIIQAEDFALEYGTNVETTKDAGGGSDMGYTNNGDWIEYNVKIASSGAYPVQFRVASAATANSAINISYNGSTVGSVAVAPTGGWQTWTTLNTSVTLPAGQGKLRLTFVGTGTGGLSNVNWMNFAALPAAIREGSATGSSAWVIPGNEPVVGLSGTWFRAVVSDAQGHQTIVPCEPGQSILRIPSERAGVLWVHLQGPQGTKTLQINTVR